MPEADAWQPPWSTELLDLIARNAASQAAALARSGSGDAARCSLALSSRLRAQMACSPAKRRGDDAERPQIDGAVAVRASAPEQTAAPTRRRVALGPPPTPNVDAARRRLSVNRDLGRLAREKARRHAASTPHKPSVFPHARPWAVGNAPETDGASPPALPQQVLLLPSSMDTAHERSAGSSSDNDDSASVGWAPHAGLVPQLGAPVEELRSAALAVTSFEPTLSGSSSADGELAFEPSTASDGGSRAADEPESAPESWSIEEQSAFPFAEQQPSCDDAGGIFDAPREIHTVHANSPAAAASPPPPVLAELRHFLPPRPLPDARTVLLRRLRLQRCDDSLTGANAPRPLLLHPSTAGALAVTAHAGALAVTAHAALEAEAAAAAGAAASPDVSSTHTRATTADVASPERGLVEAEDVSSDVSLVPPTPLDFERSTELPGELPPPAASSRAAVVCDAARAADFTAALVGALAREQPLSWPEGLSGHMPLHLLDQLGVQDDEEQAWVNRLLFDCVNEALQLHVLAASPLAASLWRHHGAHLDSPASVDAVCRAVRVHIDAWVGAANAASAAERLQLQLACDLHAGECAWAATVATQVAQLEQDAALAVYDGMLEQAVHDVAEAEAGTFRAAAG